MAKKFNIGDVVELKSGSSDMTVSGYHKYHSPDTLQEVESEDEVECTWFLDGKVQRGTFHQDMLDKDEE